MLREQLTEHLAVFTDLVELLPNIEGVAAELIGCLKRGNRIFLAGNGGSAADAQHIAAELVGRYMRERDSLPAIALTTDTSAITAIANDFGYEQVFSRQLSGLATTGDVVILYSTSGNSANMLRLAKTATEKGCMTIALTGRGGGKLANQVDICLKAPSDITPRIQEVHGFIGHVLCERIDAAFA
jgi:D-sedoheptulose 7-phosphate isomerase